MSDLVELEKIIYDLKQRSKALTSFEVIKNREKLDEALPPEPPPPLTPDQRNTALTLINDLNTEFKKSELLKQFTPVIIGGFAVSELSIFKFHHFPTDIDVKICGPNFTDSKTIQKIMDDIPDDYKQREQYGVSDPTTNISQGMNFKKLQGIPNLPLLPVIRAKIISILDPIIQDLNRNNPTNIPQWEVKNTLRPKESPDDFLPENWPIKVTNGNHQIIDISFSFKDSDSQSILCNSFDYIFKEDGKDKFIIKMATLESLAKNLLAYTTEDKLKEPLILEKLPSWNQQLKKVFISLSAKVRQMEAKVKLMKGGKKTKKKKRKTKKRKRKRKTKKRKRKRKTKKYN